MEVGGGAGVLAGGGAGHPLQHQALVALDHPGRHVVAQLLPLWDTTLYKSQGRALLGAGTVTGGVGTVTGDVGTYWGE